MTFPPDVPNHGMSLPRQSRGDHRYVDKEAQPKFARLLPPVDLHRRCHSHCMQTYASLTGFAQRQSPSIKGAASSLVGVVHFEENLPNEPTQLSICCYSPHEWQLNVCCIYIQLDDLPGKERQSAWTALHNEISL